MRARTSKHPASCPLANACQPLVTVAAAGDDRVVAGDGRRTANTCTTKYVHHRRPRRFSSDLTATPALATFAAIAGVAISVADFLRTIFADPMPPITKLEQSYAREGRQARRAPRTTLCGSVCTPAPVHELSVRRLATRSAPLPWQRRMVAYGWLAGAVALWGLYGLACLSRSTTCAGTAPQLYRLALLLSFAFCCLIAIALLVLTGVGVDFCCSGKLRVAIVFER